MSTKRPLDRAGSSLEEEEGSLWDMQELQMIVRGLRTSVTSLESMETIVKNLKTTITNLQNFIDFDSEIILCLTAAEILKWAIGGWGKKGVPTKAFNLQTPDLLTAASVLKISDFDKFKTLDLMIIESRNAVAHCASIEELNSKVKHAEAGMLLTPTIYFDHPRQVVVVQHYEDFKTSLPHVYCWYSLESSV